MAEKNEQLGGEMRFYFPILDYDKGLMLSEENARRLIEDAKILFEKKRYPSASYLAIQGIEEVGKALLFLRYKREQKKITKSQWEKVFGQHEPKLNEVQKAITKHVGKVRISEGFGTAKKYWSDDRVQKWTVGWLRRDKDDFAYVGYDFQNQKWLNPSKPDKIDYEGVVKAFVFGYTQRAIYALEKEKANQAK